MTPFSKYRIAAMLAFPAVVLPAAASAGVVVSNSGPSTVGADSVNGRAIRVVSNNHGTAKVVIETTPPVALVCDKPEAASTTCHAYVQPGIRVAARIRRAGARPGSAFGPKPAEWGYHCAGTTGDTCTVVMDQVRNMVVNWK